MRSLALCLLLSGCALGSTRLGEQWTKDGASASDREATVANCKAQMEGRAPVYDPTVRFVTFVPGHAAYEVGSDIAARKEFSRGCMNSQGWTLR